LNLRADCAVAREVEHGVQPGFPKNGHSLATAYRETALALHLEVVDRALKDPPAAVRVENAINVPLAGLL
jgi:hypothetical protein